MNDDKTPQSESEDTSDVSNTDTTAGDTSSPTEATDAAATSDTSDDATQTEAPEPDAQFDDAPPAAEKKKGSGRWLLALAALVVLAVLAWMGRDLFSGSDSNDTATADIAETSPGNTTPQSNPEPAPASTRSPAGPDLIPAATAAEADRLRDDVASLNTQLNDVSQTLAQLQTAINQQARQTNALEADIEQRVDLLDSLPGRVRNTEEALVTLQGISAGSRSAWLLAEAEYYMQIANAQLQLANNPELATKALRLADQRVRELADPAYTPVRRALAEELTALAGVKSSDIEGVTLTLGSLASLVAELPLDNTIERTTGQNDTDETLTGMARVKATISNAASSLVSWRKSDEAVKALLSPEAEYFLRLNVQLQLQAARLSLLLGDNAGYQQSLGDARAWINDYFDRKDERVANALELIAGIADAKRNQSRPDISGSLTMLRQQRDLANFGGNDSIRRRAAPAAEDDATTTDNTGDTP